MVATQDTIKNKNKTTAETDRDKIKRILAEFNLDPRDYTFNSLSEQSSGFTSPILFKYSPKSPLSPSHPRPLFQSGRPLSYVHLPPPPPNINRQTPNDMAQQTTSPRRTPPPPPRPPSRSLSNQNIINSNSSAEHYLRQISTIENPPVKIIKPSTQDIIYRKEIRIRYLQPPTPPPPAPIIIREKHLPPIPPESPLLIRERKPEPHTPPPLIIRERPPTPPATLEPYIIDKPIHPPPRQPRQIIVERLPTPPPKPRTVIFEKWLPYKKVKRPILLQKAPPIPPVEPKRNVVIEYEPLKAYTVRRVIEEGIFRVDPARYSSYHTQQADVNVRIVDRIDDLPPPSDQLRRVLQDYNQHVINDPNPGISLNLDDLTSVTRSANTSVHSPTASSVAAPPPPPPPPQTRTPSTVKSDN